MNDTNSDTNRLGQTMHVKYCPIHLSTFLRHDHLRNDELSCAWDKATGPRPGRGICEIHDATVIIGYGVRVWELEKAG